MFLLLFVCLFFVVVFCFVLFCFCFLFVCLFVFLLLFFFCFLFFVIFFLLKGPVQIGKLLSFSISCFDKKQDRLRECSKKQGIYIDQLDA